MMKLNKIGRATLGTALAAALAASFAASGPSPAMAQGSPASAYRPTTQVRLSVGEGELISLPRNVANVWTSNADVADVQVNNPRQIGLFGKANGEATVIATAADGTVVYGAHVTVSQNLSSIDQMLRAAMPDADITVTHVGQLAVLNGTVASPEDSAQAEQLVRALLNPGIDTTAPNATLRILPVNRLRTATPLQVNLQVRIVEVNRSLMRNIGVNLLNSGTTQGGFNIGVFQGEGIHLPEPDDDTPSPPQIIRNPIGTTIGLAGRVLGADIFSAINLGEQTGLATTLAEPNLTALSGETASFLAGGEFPIPTAQGISGTAIEFKQYGVSLAFTPTVLAGGRISMRVRPEVSELSTEGSIRLNGFEVPSLTTRRTETTVELGSGQSMMISGLLRNTAANSINRAPGLGRLPILGALFRSTGFRRNETELVIIITPYLVQPVNANQIRLPTDGYRVPNDVQQLLLGAEHAGRSGEQRPTPVAGPPQTVAPGVGPTGSAAPRQLPGAPAPVREARRPAAAPPPQTASAASPGFNF